MKKIFILCVIAASFYSCDKDFEEINTNPNLPNTIEPSLLLRQVIYNYGEEMSYEGFVAGNLLAQQFTMVDFNLFDRHSLSDPQLGGNPWPKLYKNLRDNEVIHQLSQENQAYEVYEGPSLILKAYIASAITDIYGDVPYSEAVKGTEGVTQPKYDLQEDIYLGQEGIFENLNQGISAIENYQGTLPLDGDILFDGDLDAWIRFAHSLQIKYLMRVSKKIDVSSDLQDLFDEGNYILDNTQNATFDFANTRPNSFRMEQLRDGDFNLFVLSTTAEEILNGLNDPRINVLFRPYSNDNTQTQFNGLLNGPDASSTSISVADYSLPGTIFRTHTGDLDANFMTAWETQFLLAEAAEKGLINTDPKPLYDLGVQLAFEYWHTDLPSDYLTNQGAYGQNGANKIEQIITQKWIANSINGYEDWIEYRRTGFPHLKTVAASLNNGLIPVRMPYPTDEAALNTANYNLVTQNNGNDINLPVWWSIP